MNKKSTSTKDTSRISEKKNSLKHLQPLTDKDFSRRSSHPIRAITSAVPRPKSTKNRLLKPQKPSPEDFSDSSMDPSDYPKRTYDLKIKILDSLETLKLASAELCDLSFQFTQNFSRLNEDFNEMQKEIKTLLNESERSAQEISKIKLQFIDSSCKQVYLSTKNSPGTVSETCFDPQEKIYYLKKQLEVLKEDVIKNEVELSLDNKENKELRAKTYKLQDNFEEVSENEEATKTAACKKCRLF